jgi:hypothetical protein
VARKARLPTSCGRRALAQLKLSSKMTGLGSRLSWLIMTPPLETRMIWPFNRNWPPDSFFLLWKKINRSADGWLNSEIAVYMSYCTAAVFSFQGQTVNDACTPLRCTSATLSSCTDAKAVFRVLAQTRIRACTYARGIPSIVNRESNIP